MSILKSGLIYGEHRWFWRCDSICDSLYKRRSLKGLTPVLPRGMKRCFRNRELVWRCAGCVSLIANKIKAKLSREIWITWKEKFNAIFYRSKNDSFNFINVFAAIFSTCLSCMKWNRNSNSNCPYISETAWPVIDDLSWLLQIFMICLRTKRFLIQNIRQNFYMFKKIFIWHQCGLSENCAHFVDMFIYKQWEKILILTRKDVTRCIKGVLRS